MGLLFFFLVRVEGGTDCLVVGIMGSMCIYTIHLRVYVCVCVCVCGGSGTNMWCYSHWFVLSVGCVQFGTEDGQWIPHLDLSLVCQHGDRPYSVYMCT